jgi:thiol-disulfide isomerase/thioredoxin
MKLISKRLLLGFGLGVALTLAGLDVWGARYRQQLYFSTMPAVLRPFLQEPVSGIPLSSDRLPKPWVPSTSSNAHEHWRIRSLDGNPVELGAFKGKVVFLDFWGTFCGPCLAELPGIARLAQSLRNDNVAFLVVTQEKPERVKEFLSKNKLALPVYLADEELPPDLPVDGIPTTYILDRNGNAVYRAVGGANWDYGAARAFLQTLETR